MNARTDIERALDRWLGGPDDRLPDGVLGAALGRVSRTRQRRSWTELWRKRPTTVSVRLALLAVAGALIVGAGIGAGAFRVSQGPGPTPSARSTNASAVPSPSAGPSAPVGHSGTIVFEAHGGGIGYGVFAIDARGGTPRRLGPTGACCFALSADGSQVALSVPGEGNRRASFVVGLDGNGGHEIDAAVGSASVEPGAWSLSGQIAYDVRDGRRPGTNGIYLGSASGDARLVRLTQPKGGLVDRALAFSPDGTWLLFERVTDEAAVPSRGDLYTVNLTDPKPRRLNPEGLHVTDEFGSPGSWSPDGGLLAFAAFNDNGASDLDVGWGGGSVVSTVAQGPWITTARFSPDGRSVLYDRVYDPAGDHRLFVQPPFGTVASEVPYGGAVCCAAWAPDGAAFVLAEPDLVVVEADGLRATTLVHASGEIGLGQYAWSAATP